MVIYAYLQKIENYLLFEKYWLTFNNFESLSFFKTFFSTSFMFMPQPLYSIYRRFANIFDNTTLTSSSSLCYWQKPVEKFQSAKTVFLFSSLFFNDSSNSMNLSSSLNFKVWIRVDLPYIVMNSKLNFSFL